PRGVTRGLRASVATWCARPGRVGASVVGVAEDGVERRLEGARDEEGHLERGRVAPLLDRDDGLARRPDGAREFGLRAAALRASLTDLVGDARGSSHGTLRGRRAAARWPRPSRPRLR